MVKEKELKLHIGCGTVYLEGYINIHPSPDGLALFYPEEVERNKTTVDKYYTSNFDDRSNFHVADVKASLDNLSEVLPSKYGKIIKGSVKEICMFHVLEHIPQYEVNKVLDLVSDLLIDGGVFRVAVPDIDGFVLEFAEKLKSGISEEEKEWYYRCIYGTQKDKWSHHYCGYNKDRLINLLKRYKFTEFEDLPNQNFYPSVHLLAKKLSPQLKKLQEFEKDYIQTWLDLDRVKL